MRLKLLLSIGERRRSSQQDSSSFRARISHKIRLIGISRQQLVKSLLKVSINNTPMPFWTSDHPVNSFNPVGAKPYGNPGLLCKGIEIHFPLSPKIVLSFCDPTTYELLPSRYEIKDIQSVIFENWLQVAHSTRYLFSNINDFTLAERILRDNPSLREIDRKRIQVN